MIVNKDMKWSCSSSLGRFARVSNRNHAKVAHLTWSRHPLSKRMLTSAVCRSKFNLGEGKVASYVCVCEMAKAEYPKVIARPAKPPEAYAYTDVSSPVRERTKCVFSI